MRKQRYSRKAINAYGAHSICQELCEIATFNLDDNPTGYHSHLQIADKYTEGQEVKSAAQVTEQLRSQ